MQAPKHAPQNDIYQFQFDSHSFIYKGTLQYSTGELPEFLKFDPEQRKFTGTPEVTWFEIWKVFQKYEITITATSIETGRSVPDSFYINTTCSVNWLVLLLAKYVLILTFLKLLASARSYLVYNKCMSHLFSYTFPEHATQGELYRK